jgi:hypothetical protein
MDFNKSFIIQLRKKFKKDKFGDIYILSKSNDYNYNKDNKTEIDGLLYFPSYESLKPIVLGNSKNITYFYTQILYMNLLGPNTNNNNIFKMSFPISKYPIYSNSIKNYIFYDYSPEKFYFLNKVIIDWTKMNHNSYNQYIFIEGSQNLQYDDNLGFANINYFSKALYQLPLIDDRNNRFNIQKLKTNTFVLVQVHLYYIDLIEEIINKTNNIPVPFDLYITTNTQTKKQIIEKSVKIYSNANIYVILVIQNKGRDIIPCLIQLKNNLLKYHKSILHTSINIYVIFIPKNILVLII